jgi:hypothetical protein
VDRWKQGSHNAENTVFCSLTQCTLAERYRSVFYPEHKGSIPPKRWYLSTRLHSVPSQKTEIFIFTTITTSNLTSPECVSFINFVERTQHIPVFLGEGGGGDNLLVCLTFVLETAEKLNTIVGWVVLGATWTCHSCMLDRTWKQHEKYITSTVLDS